MIYQWLLSTMCECASKLNALPTQVTVPLPQVLGFASSRVDVGERRRYFLLDVFGLIFKRRVEMTESKILLTHFLILLKLEFFFKRGGLFKILLHRQNYYYISIKFQYYPFYIFIRVNSAFHSVIYVIFDLIYILLNNFFFPQNPHPHSSI